MKLTNHTADVFLLNVQGEMLLQLRASGEEKYPLHWDFSAAGNAEPGETAEEAAQRELQEELGVQCELRLWKQFEDITIFTGEHNGPFAPNENEVQRVEFFTAEAIKHMRQTGVLFHPEFARFLDAVLPGISS